MRETERGASLDAAITRWNALVTANFPAIKHSLEAARSGLGEFARAFEEKRILSQSLARRQDLAPEDLEKLPTTLAAYHVELEALVTQVNRALESGSQLHTQLARLSGGAAPKVELLAWSDRPAPSPEERRLRAQVAQLQQELERLRASASADESGSRPSVVHDMQDEIVRLRQTMEVLQLPDADMEAAADLETNIRAHAFDSEGKRRPMGLILVKAGVISTEQLEAALSQQRNAWNRHLGSILVELGFVDDEAVAQAIAAQTRVKFVRLSDFHIDREAASLVSRKMAVHHMALPIAFRMNDLMVAMANPLDLVALEDLKLATGRPVSAVVATSRDLQLTIDRVYGTAKG
ncbi:MAG: hypothetical protein GC168_06320 [Candidatus Hydrogenedens sp.]|nr:hypothetical protein [Candidatus Hydrogenedens sp.]